MNEQGEVWTVGHSTHSAEVFGELLKAHDIETLVDVRSFPGSRRYPQFNKENLAQFLRSIGIEYVHLPVLGGRRRPNPNSHNTGLRNDSFRAYADYMDTESFQEGIEELLQLSASSRTAMMCAESLWWRCHRSLVSDYLKWKGVEVRHILNAKKTELHHFTSAARIVDGELTYRGLLDVV
ncbi:MAG TPA: DUF488 domain-containing protein [Pyrinomonadaceae bacterium]